MLWFVPTLNSPPEGKTQVELFDAVIPPPTTTSLLAAGSNRSPPTVTSLVTSALLTNKLPPPRKSVLTSKPLELYIVPFPSQYQNDPSSVFVTANPLSD